jgi:hypothetical protein
MTVSLGGRLREIKDTHTISNDRIILWAAIDLDVREVMGLFKNAHL